MRLWQTKADNTAPATTGVLRAAEDNARGTELSNFVASAGIPLDAYNVTNDTDLYMLAQAVSRYASGGTYGLDTGAANSYVVGFSGTFKPPKAFFDGMMVWFYPGHSNTGASTLNAWTLGPKAILSYLGAPLVGGEIVANVATLCIYSTGAGAFLLAPWSAPTGGGGGAPAPDVVGFRNMVVFFTPGTTAWTVPAGVTSVYVEGAGAGGGGAVSAGVYGGSPGGGGGWFEGFFTVTPGASIAVTVGAGGAGRSPGEGSPGGTGGSTSFGALATATGGVGGNYADGSSAVGGGDGGVASGGQLNIHGQVGQSSNAPSANSNYPMGGSCGRFGGGSNNGGSGLLPGSGGGAGCAYGAAGSGQKGLVTIRW